nr:hypothetical protein [Tanacetum cinerariifolium]
MHDIVQLDHVVDLHADHTSISNMILYDQYVKDIDVSVVHNNASSVLNDTFMMIYDDMCESIAPSVSNSSRNAVVKNSLTVELATYREQVKLPRLLYNDLNKVAIGYKNPLCLTRTKQAPPALYNGYKILKDNHARAKVHNTEDTLEITEITRKKMNAKMTNPECETHKVKIAPHDYSKENLLATFTPQKQLTPEQIYWSNDLMTLISEALKERAKVSRPIKAFTVEVKQMKDVFEELEAEVAQCAVDKKHDAIDRKNLLIANDNLIAEWLSKEVFSVATKSKLNVARFTEMHVANTSVEVRCLALEAELATLRDKSHQENQRELIKHFSKLEAQNDLFRAENDKIKHYYKELYDFIKITHAKHIEQATKLTTENVNLKTCVSKATVKPQVSARDKHAIDVEPIVPRLRNNRD